MPSEDHLSADARWRVVWSRRLLAAFFGLTFAIDFSGGHWLASGVQLGDTEKQSLALVALAAAASVALALTFRRNAARLGRLAGSAVAGQPPAVDLFIQRLVREAGSARRAKRSLGVLLLQVANDLDTADARWRQAVRHHLKRKLDHRFTQIDSSLFAFAVASSDVAADLTGLADRIVRILRDLDDWRLGQFQAEAGIAVSTDGALPPKDLFAAAKVGLYRAHVLHSPRYVVVDQIPGERPAA